MEQDRVFRGAETTGQTGIGLTLWNCPGYREERDTLHINSLCSRESGPPRRPGEHGEALMILCPETG